MISCIENSLFLYRKFPQYRGAASPGGGGHLGHVFRGQRAHQDLPHKICFVNFLVGDRPARPQPQPQTLPSKQTPFVWQEREVLYLCVRHCHAEGERWLPGSDPGSGLTLGMSSQDKSSICGMKMAILNRVCERGMRSTSRA